MVKNNDNQTAFQANQPMFEKELMGSVGDALKAESAAKPSKKSFFASPKGILVLLVGGLLLVIIILILLAMSLGQTIEPPATDDQADEGNGVTIEQTEFEQKIEDLRLQLLEADPVKPDVPFPPVENEIGLEE